MFPIKPIFYFSLILCLFCCFTACVDDKVKNIPDVSAIPVELKVNRFEKALFSIDTNQVAQELANIQARQPEFSNIFFNNILRAKPDDEQFIKGFVTFPGLRKLYDTTMVVYSDFSEIEGEFTQAFKYYKHYFPQQKTPEITTYISEYSFAGFIFGENSLAIGLDFYLGSGYPYLRYNQGNPNFSNYLTRTFNKSHIVSRTLSLLVEDMAGQAQGTRLLDLMIHEGKKRYVLEQLLPMTPDTVLHEYSAKQMDWTTANEGQIWAYFLTKDLLYASRQKDIRKYVEPSPNSPGMPEEAPGNIGSWLGYKIVSTYMRRFPNKSLGELLQEQDAQKMLNASKYKPPK